MEKIKVLDFYTKMATAPSHLKIFGIPFAPFAQLSRLSRS
jgi:hypothetical protein